MRVAVLKQVKRTPQNRRLGDALVEDVAADLTEVWS
jgi:hypothetical protein